jgi:hypothetical protein
MEKKESDPEVAPPGIAPNPALAEFDAALEAFVQTYVNVSARTKEVPLISVWPFIRFYALVLRWELCFLGLIFMAALNVVVAGVYLARRERIKWVGLRVWQIFAAPFKAIHRGDVSALQILTLRGLVRLVIFLRLSANLADIRDKLQEKKVEHFLLDRAAFETKWFDSRIALLQDVRNYASRKLGASIWASVVGAASVFGVVKGGFGLIPDDAKSQMSDWVSRMPGISTLLDLRLSGLSGGISSGSSEVIVFALGTIIYLGWIAASNVMAADQFLLRMGVTQEQPKTFRAMGIEPSCPVPYDLLGLLLLLLLSIPALAFDGQSADEKSSSILGVFMYTGIPLYATVRRYVMWRRLNLIEARSAPDGLPALPNRTVR